jgi:hypothetical protein
MKVYIVEWGHYYEPHTHLEAYASRHRAMRVIGTYTLTRRGNRKRNWKAIGISKEQAESGVQCHFLCDDHHYIEMKELEVQDESEPEPAVRDPGRRLDTGAGGERTRHD